MAEQGRHRAELGLIRWLLQAGLERDEEEFASLLPWLRVHRESGARIAALPLSDTEPQVVFDPRWPS
jgi:hypothetical protein